MIAAVAVVVAVALPAASSTAVAQAVSVPVAVAVLEAIEHAFCTVKVTVGGRETSGSTEAEHVSHFSPHTKGL